MNSLSNRSRPYRLAAGLAWLAALALLAASAQPALARPLQQATGPTYLYQSGDTLFDIGLRFGVTVDELLAANPGLDPAAVQLGQAIIIPGYEAEPGAVFHFLEPGETLDSLSFRFGLQRSTLVRLNRLVNPELLYINQPFVLVGTPDATTTVVSSTAHIASPTSGLLALAVSTNQNPWALAALNRLPNPGHLAPGALVVVPGGELATRALPYPLTDLRMGPFPVLQGQTFELAVTTAAPVTLAGTLGEWTLNFNSDDPASGSQYALQGIHRLAEPNVYTLNLNITQANGEVTHLAQRVPVRTGFYGAGETLSVPPETIDPANTGPEDEQIRAVVQPVTPVRMWNGLFIAPSVGVYRSLYGVPRSYNGSAFDFYHSGLDFSGAQDRPVTAPAPGVVVFTEFVTVRGRATLIDHGWGVYTGYWHQDSFQVEVGQRVETGQVIGFTGDTGRVTGPHLHWEVWVGGVPVDPFQWMETVFP